MIVAILVIVIGFLLIALGEPGLLDMPGVTPEQVGSLESKLASLKALSGKVDLAHSRLDYVNLMNQNQPVTHAIPSPSPSPRPSASPKK